MAANSQPSDKIGNYDLLDKVGAGGMGVVYRGRHWETKRLVALKVMHAEFARYPELLKRFEREFRISSQLDHPHIVRVLEFCGSGTNPYLVMEFIDGESLVQRMERAGKMPEEEAVRLICQVADGLGCAHARGLIHRDVKPENIMVTRDGQAKLLDLGLAKDTDADAELTSPGDGMGTPDFMAPEQFRNAKNANVRSDIYSLGATLYSMVTGRRYPFDEDDPVKMMIRKARNVLPRPREIVPALSERIDWAIRRAMSAALQQRPASCQEFAEDLLGQNERMPRLSESESLWYLTYTDINGREQTIKGSIEAMRHSLQQGNLGNPTVARASRTVAGPFEPLANLDDFRDLLVVPAPSLPLSLDSVAQLALRAGGVKGRSPASRLPELLMMLTLISATVAGTVIAVKCFLLGK